MILCDLRGTGTASADSRACCCSMRASELANLEHGSCRAHRLAAAQSRSHFFCCCALESAYWFQLYNAVVAYTVLDMTVGV